MDITVEKLIKLYDAISDQPYIKVTWLMKELDLPNTTVGLLKDLNFIGFEDGKHFWVDEMIPIDDLIIFKIDEEIKKRKRKRKRK